MKPLQELPPQAWRGITGVFTDIDDTLTTDGAITPVALQALQRLHEAGLHTIAITGRPAGWSEPFARQCPLKAVVAENGAVAWVKPSNATQPLRKIYLQDADTRAAQYARLQAVAARVLREVPGTCLARDSAGRETDIAIDHSEFVQLDDARIQQVLSLMHAEGLQATVSSIHINGWIGEHDKWQGARWIARELLGIPDLTQEQQRWLYIGDSTNDQVMFQHFSHSVGVANIRRFADRLSHTPAYITPSERGAGFAEMAQALLAARGT